MFKFTAYTPTKYCLSTDEKQVNKNEKLKYDPVKFFKEKIREFFLLIRIFNICTSKLTASLSKRFYLLFYAISYLKLMLINIFN